MTGLRSGGSLSRGHPQAALSSCLPRDLTLGLFLLSLSTCWWTGRWPRQGCVWAVGAVGEGWGCYGSHVTKASYSAVRAGIFRAGVGVSHESGALGLVSTHSGGGLHHSQLAGRP